MHYAGEGSLSYLSTSSPSPPPPPPQQQPQQQLVTRKLPPGSNAYAYAVVNGAPSLAHSLVLSRLSSSPTLLPENLASLITALSLCARVSIRASALFIEAILESAKYSTITGLGLTRRALISAVGSARALHYVNQKLDWSGRDSEGVKSNDAFLQVLDKYTNLGVYLIHHSFTLAELFAMSGFYLTLNTLQTGFSAAEESVRMLDGILGSNETSRALSSIITLVRQELTQDPRFSPAERGAIASLTALTKALTAFVCLQTATHKRSLKEMRLRVVYDCTIVVEGEGERDFSREEMGRRTGQGTTDVMMTDVRSELEATRPRTRTSSAPGTESMEIVNELEQLCGGEEGGAQEEEDLPEEVREALREVQAGQGMRKRVVRAGGGYEYEIELEETTTTTTTTIRTVDASSTPDDSNSLRTLSRKTKDRAGPLPTISASPSSAGRESMVVEEEEGEMQEDEWVEVSTMFGPGEGPASGGEDEEMYDRVQDIPGAFNGKQSVATLTRQDTLDHPEESRQRLQVVLRTMTKKFTQRKRTLRRVEVPSRNSSPSGSASSASGSPRPSTSGPQRRGDVRSIEWPTSSSAADGDAEMEYGRRGKPRGGVLRAFSKALKGASGGNSSSSSLDKSRPSSPTPSRPSSRAPSSSQPASSSPRPKSRAPPSDPCPPPLPSKTSGVPPRLRRAASIQSMRSVMTTCTHTAATPAEEPEPKASNFPHRHLVENLQHFMRYSSAAYGQVFLRILGIGKHDFNFPHTQTHANNHAFAHHVGINVDDILLSSYTDPAPGFSTAKIAPIVNYVAVDHSISAIVLSCRGSLGLSDILVDLTCSYEPIPVEHGDPKASYYVHSGMFCSATTLQRGTVHDTIREALENFPTYGLVLCGHSLGGGVAALLSILWSSPVVAFEEQSEQYLRATGERLAHPPIRTPFVTGFSSGLPAGRPISCFSYGPPCVASPDLVRYCQGLVTSTIHNYDIVPTLSLGVLQDLKSMAMGLYSEGGTAEEIVGRVIGLYQRRFMASRATKKEAPVPMPTPSGAQAFTPSLSDAPDEAREVPLSNSEIDAGRGSNRALDPAYRDPSLVGAEVSEDVELNDWLWSLVKTMRAGNDAEKLYPPGSVYVIENYTVFISGEASTSGCKSKYSRREGRRIILRAVDNVETRFSEPVFGRTMMSDHSPLCYEQNVDLLATAVIGSS